MAATDDYREIEEKQVEEAEEEEHGHPFWPTHVLNQVNILYALGGLLITLAILVPFHLQGPADPMRTPEGIKPEWYFLSAYQVLKYVPKVLGVMLVGLAAVLLVIWPFIDPFLDRRFGRTTFRKVGVVGLIIFLALGLLGWISEETLTFFGRSYSFDLRGIPHQVTVQEKTTEPASSSGATEQSPASGTANQSNGQPTAKEQP